MVASPHIASGKDGKPHRVVIVVEEAFEVIDLGGPLQVLATANDFKQYYEVSTASAHGGRVAAACGLTVEADPLAALSSAEIDTLVLIGGRSGGRGQDRFVAGWLEAQARRIKRLCGIGFGVETLRASGLASPDSAARHWRSGDPADPGSRRWPIARRDGRVWTSCGASAAIDVTLSLVAEDLGEPAALAVAEALVVPLWRHPDDPQVGDTLAMQVRAGVPFAALLRRMRNNLAPDLRVEQLAEWCNMTPRTFARRFTESTGMTPAAAVAAMRLEAATALLKAGHVSLKQVAARCGFGSELNLRRALERARRSGRPGVPTGNGGDPRPAPGAAGKADE
jgi:transcriptional regulator GlxA family with amidase domain